MKIAEPYVRAARDIRDSELRTFAQTAATDERHHVAWLRSALGARARREPAPAPSL